MKLDRSTEVGRCWHNDGMSKEKLHFDNQILNKLFSLISLRYFLKEIENMLSLVIETLLKVWDNLKLAYSCNSLCSHSISHSPKLSRVFLLNNFINTCSSRFLLGDSLQGRSTNTAILSNSAWSPWCKNNLTLDGVKHQSSHLTIFNLPLGFVVSCFRCTSPNSLNNGHQYSTHHLIFNIPTWQVHKPPYVLWYILSSFC